MKNAVILRKIGGFYTCFDNDAYIISYLCDYKIKNGRVGFPVNTLNKVTNMLESKTINYIVKENMEDVMKKNYKNNKYNYYLEQGKKKNNINDRINDIMNKIYTLTEDKLESLLCMIEENI